MIENDFVFLDSASTTRPKFFRSDYKELWFNSNMSYAYDEQYKVQEAEDKVKKCLGVKGGHVLWFRCATEASQWLIGQMGTGETLCFDIEHDSVYDVCAHNDVDYTPVAVAYQYVNQMTGHITPIEALNGMSNFFFSDFFFSDLTAAIGHVKLPTNLEEISDACWFSGHKFHTEKGIGAMWVSDKLFNYLSGTKSPRNQFGLVHGSLDVAGCLMLADAMENACIGVENNEAEWEMLSDIILRDLRDNDIGCNYVANNTPRTHAINALWLNNIEADALATYLQTRNIYVGVGHSACADNKDYRVLKAFGYSEEKASQVIRVSFDEDTTIHDIKELIEAIIDFKRRFV